MTRGPCGIRALPLRVGRARIGAAVCAAGVLVACEREDTRPTFDADMQAIETPASVPPGPRMCTLREVAPSDAFAAVDTAEAENPANMRMRVIYQPAVTPRVDARIHGALMHSKRWRPGRTLRVAFQNGDSLLRARVMTAAREWTRYANVKFAETNDRTAEIRVRFTDDGASWSYLGTDAELAAPGAHTMQFGWLTRASPEADLRAVVLHEFGHALGFIHEHQSPQASIPWDTAAVYAYYSSRFGWGRDQVNVHVFRRYRRAETQYSAFDTASIMLYAIPEQLTIGNYAVGWNSALSNIDKLFARQMYR